MAQQTAVEWLATYLKGITSLNCDDIIEQAKAMEKEQIIEAVNYGDERGKLRTYLTAEQYYNETYEK
jgi:hypothetical protein